MYRKSCGGNFFGGAGCVFGFEIEKLIFWEYFGNWKNYFFVFDFYQSAGKFLAIDKLFNQCFAAFFPCF
jgi:hypothetical protein